MQLFHEKGDKLPILIVDDEPNVLFVLGRALMNDGYALDTAADGVEALKKIQDKRYHLILLDLNMKPMNGIQLLRELRKTDTNVAVIILTAHSSIESAVEALHLGAFDYLFKPATPEVIRQRVREGLHHYEQSIRRSHLLEQIDSLRTALQDLEVEEKTFIVSETPGRFVRVGELIIDDHHRVATLAGRLIDLTTTEFDLLACLVRASPKPISPRQLLNCALGYDGEDGQAREIIKWHIHQLRQKVEPNPNIPCYIKTVRYKGYMWNS